MRYNTGRNTGRNRRLLAGVVGVNLALALAVSAGAVPRPGDHDSVLTASVAQVEEVAAPIARQPGDTAVQAPVPTTSAAPVPSATPTQVAAPRTTAPPTTAAPTRAAVATRSTTPAPTATTAAPVVATPAASGKVPRRTPTDAEVQPLIAELKVQIGGLAVFATITPAQIADAGNQICTAFDNGQSFAQVKSTGLTMIPPSIAVKPATVDWAVRKGVALYCPGHASKLV